MQPDAVADIKRELAKKGILEGFVEDNEDKDDEAEFPIPNAVADPVTIDHQEPTEISFDEPENDNTDYRKVIFTLII